MAEAALKLVSRLGVAAAVLGIVNETCLYDGEPGEEGPRAAIGGALRWLLASDGPLAGLVALVVRLLVDYC